MGDKLVKKIKDIQQQRRQYVKDRFIKDWRFEAEEFIKYCHKCYNLEKIEDLIVILWHEEPNQKKHHDFASAVIYNVNNVEIIDMLWRYFEVYDENNRVSFGDWI